MISGCAAGVAGDDRFLGQRGFDVDQAEGLAVGWQAHDVDGSHQVGHVATEAEEADAIGQAGGVDLLLELAAQGAFAAAPELGLGHVVEDQLGGARLTRGSLSLRRDGRRCR